MAHCRLTRILLLFFCLILSCGFSHAEPLIAQTEPLHNEESHYDPVDISPGISDHFHVLFKTLTFATTQKASDSKLNPDNTFLQIPRYTIEGELRPDFSLNFDSFQLSAKPRVNVAWKRWEDSPKDGEDNINDDWYVNEWLASLRFFNRLYLSYGRENLQWGPSYLLSPSNPFFRDNGQSNPKREVPGMDFGRLVWIINPHWTVSAIANTDEGRQEFANGFDPTYALKLDFTGYKKYFSLIGSKREGNQERLGAFAGWTASDAIMLYTEGSIGKSSNALYPEQDLSSPFGIAMTEKKKNDNSFEKSLLVGISYTLEMGPTFTVEYLYNSFGYDDQENTLYYQLQQRASAFLTSPPPLGAVSREALGQCTDPGLRFLRQNYLMAQYLHSHIHNKLNLTFRYIHNLDDHGGQFIPIAELDIGDHFQLFFVGSMNIGSKDTEFKRFIDHYAMLGLEYTF
jgi:hypothetical protein